MQKKRISAHRKSFPGKNIINKRQKIREQEKKRFGGRFSEEKSPAWMMAELYV